MVTLEYFSSGTRVRQYMGYSRCRFCGEMNGSAELTDGTYIWPEGLAHYLCDHNMRLPQVLVDCQRRPTARDVGDERRGSGMVAKPEWAIGATPRCREPIGRARNVSTDTNVQLVRRAP